MYITLQFLLKLAKARPKLLLAAVILFSGFWSILTPLTDTGQLFSSALFSQSGLVVQEDSEDKHFLGLQPPYLFANASAAFISSGVLAVQIESAAGAAREGDETAEANFLASLGQTAILSSVRPITFISQEPRIGLIAYVVQPGDTASSIAAFFGITTETLLWVNKLQETSIMQPGDELIVLPVSGVLHKVKNGQTVSWLAQYYKAEPDDILAFNDLPADGEIKDGQELIIPGGEMPVPPQPKPKPKQTGGKSNYAGPGTGQSRPFPYGQCTWYVAQKRVVPWSGNAKDWINNAEAMGYPVCRGPQCQPKVGAIISVSGNTRLIRRYGHVAYVEAVEGDWITISEMNFSGWGIKSVRTIHKDSALIRGYIY